MNRSAGGVLAMLIVASLLARSSGSRQEGPAPGGTKAQSSTTHAKGKTAAKDANQSPKDGDLPVPPDPRCFLIRPIADFYGTHEAPRLGNFFDAYKNQPNGCNPQEGGTTWGIPQGLKPPVRFVIATVADPVRSHLSLYFDRSIDAIQQGAQSAGYVFSRSAMPWDWERHEPPADLPTKLAWDHYQREKEKLPGLMIFRKINTQINPKTNHAKEEIEDLFVWIVGETPTGGIHKHQFDKALQIMRDIAGAGAASSVNDQSALSILGPTFSGSLPSLVDLLAHLQPPIQFKAAGSAKAKTLDGVVVHSGTIESAIWSKWFQSVPGLASFISFQESDEAAECKFLRYALSQHFRLNDVAELSEDETVFGGAGGGSDISQHVCGFKDTGREGRDILHLKFPREISQLRAAYQSELQPIPETATGGKSAPRTTLPLDLQDSGSDEDTVPTYAHAQYPLSQESVMLSITTALRAHHSRFVLLKASDPIDKLFLVRFLRQDYPEGRVVTFGSDLLYRREVEDDLLHGIMAITPYSLLPRADDQVAIPECREKQQHIDRIFPSSDSAGEYNAMLSLLPEPQNCPSAGANEIPRGPYTEFGWPMIGGTAPPANNQLRPALWLTVLGRDAYWPVDLLDVDSGDVPSAIPPSALPTMPGTPWSPSFHLPRAASWLLLGGFAGVLCFTLVYLLCCGTLLSSSEAIAHFAPIKELWRMRLLALLCLLALLALALTTLPWGWWAGVSLPCWAWALRVAIVAVWMLLGAFFWHRLHKRQADPRLQLTYIGLAITLPIAAFMIWHFADGQPAIWNPFFFRYIHATSGVSLLPCALLLVAAGLWWGWHSLQGLPSIENRRPQLPKAGNDARWTTSLFSLTEEGNQSLLSALRPSFIADKRIYIPAVLVVSVVLYAAAAGTSMRWPHPLQTLEFPWIDWVFALAHSAVALVLIFELSRLVVCWMELRQSLRALDRLPLRRAFRELKDFSWNWLWSLEGGSAQDGYRASSREMEALLHLNLSASQVSPDPERITILQKIRVNIAAARPPSPAGKRFEFKWTNDLLCDVAKLYDRLAVECRNNLDILWAIWGTEANTSLFLDADPKSPPDPAVPEEIRKREQFVALVYVNFVVAVLLRMRTIIVTIAGLYILLPLSISFYPVEPKVILRALLIILFFVVVGVVGLVYWQMHKDAILSRLTDTTPGELGLDFYFKMGTFVIFPLISLLVSQFPDVNNFLFSWLQPAMQALNH